MIRITRKTPEPNMLRSRKVQEAAAAIAEIARSRKPLSKEFPSHWGEPDIRRTLWEMQHHKCCYCERKREMNRESDVEHFRPKADVTEADIDHPGYWWLAYNWDNLFFSCRYCNQEHKKNHFPVADEAKRVRLEAGSLVDEDGLLINPTEKDPQDHIGFDWVETPTSEPLQWLAMAFGRTAYGSKTIEVVGLNECELPTERGELVIEMETLVTLLRVAESGKRGSVEKYAAQIRTITSSKWPFAGFRRDYFRKAGLGKYVASD